MTAAFHDLCCTWQEASVHTQRERTIMATRLGLDCFALANDVDDSLSDRDKCSMQPLNLASLQGTSSLQDAVRMRQGLPWQHGIHSNVKQLTRLTVSTEDSSSAAQAFSGTHAAANSYHLLAVQPMSERVLQQACTSLEVDVITFDLSKRLPFRLKPGPLQSALKRGLFLEICYAPALREETARRNIFTNALALTRATRGKGIIISSGARSAFELRGPYDVINMATLFGLSEQDAKAALTKNCEAVLAHAQARKAYRGAVLIQPTENTQEQGISDPDLLQPASAAFQRPGASGEQPVVMTSTPANKSQGLRPHSAGKRSMPNTNKQRKRKSR